MIRRILSPGYQKIPGYGVEFKGNIILRTWLENENPDQIGEMEHRCRVSDTEIPTDWTKIDRKTLGDELF